MDTLSSDSSTGEPTAVRRRVDLAGNFTATRRGRSSVRRQSRGREKAKEYSPYSDVSISAEAEILAEIACASSSYASFSNRVADHRPSVDDQCLTSSVPRETARDAGDGQQQEVLIISSESSESLNRSERIDSQERYNSVVHETVSLQFSDTESATEVDDCLLDFGGTTFSLVALDASYEKADELLELEKLREEEVFTSISSHLSKVSLLTSEFHGIKAPVSKFVTDILNHSLQLSPRCGVEGSSVSSIEKRFEAIRTYVLDVFTVSLRQANAVKFKEQVAQLRREQLITTAGSDDDSTKYDTTGKENTVLQSACNSVRKSRQVVARQLKIIDKLCAVAEKVVAKTEISCRAIYNCLKTVVSVLEPVVGMNWIMTELERKLESEGKGVAEFSDAASATKYWASEALTDAEVAVVLHLEASRVVKAAWGDLEMMRSYQPLGVATFQRIAAAGDRVLDTARHPTVRLGEMEDCETNMKLIRGSLSPLLEDMRNYRTLIEEWGGMCAERVPDTLEALSSVTQDSCNAIEASLRGLSLLPFDLREKFKDIQILDISDD